MPAIHVCAVTRNKAMHATTMHSIMNLHMYCMMKGFHLEVHFVKDAQSAQRFIKSGVDRLVFMDYGVSIDQESVIKACEPFDKYNVLVFPAVTEGINWARFRKTTLEGTKEPVDQRGLEFDTVLGQKIADSFYLIQSSEAKAWAMDIKPIEKKAKTVVKNRYNTPGEFFKALQASDVKIGAYTAARVIMHYTHECFGNILEASGVNLENGNPPPVA